MSIIHFKANPEFIVLTLIQIEYEKTYHKVDQEGILLNTIFFNKLQNDSDKQVIWNEFVEFMKSKKETTIDICHIKEFMREYIQSLKKSDEFKEFIDDRCSSYIYDRSTGYLKLCDFGDHQKNVIEWLKNCFQNPWSEEENQRVQRFAENNLIVKGNCLSTDELIRSSVEFCWLWDSTS